MTVALTPERIAELRAMIERSSWAGMDKEMLAELAPALLDAAEENARLCRLPEWIIAKLKTMTEYYEPPTDGRDITSEIQGWMHVLCFHYEQNRREVKEFDAARRKAKELIDENAKLRVEAVEREKEMDSWCRSQLRQDESIAALEAERDQWRTAAWMHESERDAALAMLDAARQDEREACSVEIREFIVSKAGENYHDQHIGCYFDDAIAAIRSRSNQSEAK